MPIGENREAEPRHYVVMPDHTLEDEVATALAARYGVESGALIHAVKRNRDRFPPDVRFQHKAAEADDLRCQFGISKPGRSGRRYLPVLSGVLRSREAVRVNVAIMRAFVRPREALGLHRELAAKLAALEHKVEGHDNAIRSLFEAMRQLMAPTPATSKPEIGFHVKEDAIPYRVNDGTKPVRRALWRSGARRWTDSAPNARTL